ncbi:MAG: hypothetical protein ACHQIL_12010 [Steroidobacterales bacterium]
MRSNTPFAPEDLQRGWHVNRLDLDEDRRTLPRMDKLHGAGQPG